MLRGHFDFGIFWPFLAIFSPFWLQVLHVENRGCSPCRGAALRRRLLRGVRKHVCLVLPGNALRWLEDRYGSFRSSENIEQIWTNDCLWLHWDALSITELFDLHYFPNIPRRWRDAQRWWSRPSGIQSVEFGVSWLHDWTVLKKTTCEIAMPTFKYF